MRKTIKLKKSKDCNCEPMTRSPFLGTTITASLWPQWNFDQWRDFMDRVRRELEILFGGPTRTVPVHRQRGACTLNVICETTVIVHQNGNGQPLNNRIGLTLYKGTILETGRTYGPVDPKLCYAQIVIQFEVHLNLAKAGKRWREDNDNVLRARRQANKRFEFAKLPLEFMLLHEQLHVAEACAALSAIAGPFLRCDLKEIPQNLLTQLQNEWNRITRDTEIEGPTEQRIRTGVWDEWDRQYP